MRHHCRTSAMLFILIDLLAALLVTDTYCTDRSRTRRVSGRCGGCHPGPAPGQRGTRTLRPSRPLRTLETSSQLPELLTHCRRLGDTTHCVGSLLTMLQVGVCVVYILCIDTNLNRYLLFDNDLSL